MVQTEKVRVEFSQRLAQACKNAGLDDHGRGMALARALGVTSKAVSKWFNAESVPRQDKMNEIARFLRVDVVWLQHGKTSDGSNAITTDIGSLRIPLLNYVQAGLWTVSQEIRSEDGGYQYTLTDLDCSPFTFAVEIEGESMLPQFKPGDRIIVDPEVLPAPGDFVVARHNGFEETVFKKYRRTGTDEYGNDTFELVPLNDDYPTLKSASDVLEVLGTMIEHRIRRRRG